jgi:TRAP-type C4-dicarboxylate transport system substrate-binding protein
VDAHCSASELLFCLNKDRYNALPDDLKALIDASGQWFRDRMGELFAQQREDMVALAESMNIPVVPITDEFAAELATAAEQVWKAWIEEMTAAGYDGQGIFDKTKEFIEYYNGVTTITTDKVVQFR